MVGISGMGRIRILGLSGWERFQHIGNQNPVFLLLVLGAIALDESDVAIGIHLVEHLTDLGLARVWFLGVDRVGPCLSAVVSWAGVCFKAVRLSGFRSPLQPS
jgi:hypothetical protein